MSQKDPIIISFKPKSNGIVIKTVAISFFVALVCGFSARLIFNSQLNTFTAVLMIALSLISFFAFVFSYRCLSSLRKKKWLRISENSLRDNYSLLGLKKVPNTDVNWLSIGSLFGLEYLYAKVRLTSQCFKDLNEPKGILLDLYNLVLGGRVYWPLFIFRYNKTELQSQLAEINSLYIDLTKSIPVDAVATSEPAFALVTSEFDSNTALREDFFGPPKLADHEDLPGGEPGEADSIEENQTATDFMKVLTPDKTGPIDISSRADAEEKLFLAKKLCDAYFDTLRMLPKWSTESESLIPTGISNISSNTESESSESVVFDFSGVRWEFGISMNPLRDHNFLNINYADTKVFTCEVEIEIGTLEPTNIVYSATGPWQQQVMQLLELINNNPAQAF